MAISVISLRREIWSLMALNVNSDWCLERPLLGRSGQFSAMPNVLGLFTSYKSRAVGARQTKRNATASKIYRKN
jgi:hypothetical protein